MGCSHLKNFVETDKFVIVDFDTIQQFTYFNKQKNGTYSAEKGKHDDLITPLIHLSYFLSQENLVSLWLEKEDIMKEMYEGAMEQIESNLLPVGFFPDHFYNEN